MRKTITVVGAVVLLVLACVAVFGSGNTTEAEYPNDSGKLKAVTGKVQGYTIHNGLYHVIVNAISYKIKGVSTEDVESMIGSEVTMKLIEKEDYYEYIGIEHPIKEEVISMNISEEDVDMVNFCDWLEEKHPILNNLLWRRYNRLNG